MNARNTICPRCSAVVEAGSRFCTHCGSLVEEQPSSQPSQAGWSQGQGQPVSQVPSWATANPSQQQQAWAGPGIGSTQNGLFGQTVDTDTMLKKALLAIIGLAIGTLVLLVLFGLLAAFIPGLRCAFLIVIAVVFLIPWIIYTRIRRSIRRTVGSIGGLWWLF